jgi:glutathione peroxidase
MRMIICLLLVSSTLAADEPADTAVPESLAFEVKSLDGKDVNLADYQGKVVLIVNVASQCGATPQYEGLQELYEKYEDDGLVVLGFPCNQFGAQEPGTAVEIQEFCTSNYHVTFPLFEKIDVNGDEAAPLYQYLTAQETAPKAKGKIGWNFEKFLLGKDGAVVGRYATGTEPAELEETIQAALEK